MFAAPGLGWAHLEFLESCVCGGALLTRLPGQQCTLGARGQQKRALDPGTGLSTVTDPNLGSLELPTVTDPNLGSLEGSQCS